MKKSELIQKYKDKTEQLQKEVKALERNTSHITIGEVISETNELTEDGVRIRNAALAHHTLMIQEYDKFIVELEALKNG